MARFSLHTVGKDQPGIVAGVTVALTELGANLEESNMTILHGQSAIMLVLEIPNLYDGRLIEGALEQVAEKFNLFVTVCPLPEEPPTVPQGDSYLVTLTGADRPDVVAKVTTAISEIGANVIDLTFRPVTQGDQISRVLRLSVALPTSVPQVSFENAISTAATALGGSHSIRPWAGELHWGISD